MIRGIVITHSDFGEGVIKSVEMIAGKQEGLDSIKLIEGKGLFDIVDEIKKIIEFNKQDTYVLFVDMFGATPFNASCLIVAEYETKLVTGVNLPVLLTFVLGRKNKNIDDLIEEMIEAGSNSIKNITKEMISN